MKKDWINSFFGGKEDFYGRGWKNMNVFNSEKTEKEVFDILRLLLKPELIRAPLGGRKYDVVPDGHILDWCGGWGRHAIPLAREGFEVTLLDFCKDYLEEAEQEAKKLGVTLNLVQADFRNTPSDIQADYAINIYTAGLGYLGEENDIIALKSLFSALKPGAWFLIETMNIFWIAKEFQEYSWKESSDQTKRMFEKRKIDFWNNTNHARITYQDTETKKEEERKTSVKMYSPAELARVLKIAGFKPLKLYGRLDGSEFNFRSRRIVMVSERP